jgi:hypothetical protein
LVTTRVIRRWRLASQVTARRAAVNWKIPVLIPCG